MQLDYPLPKSDSNIDVERLANCFEFTASSYKFFWLKSILRSVLGGADSFSYSELSFWMVSFAWHPVSIHKLYLGDKDSIPKTIELIQRYLEIDENLKSENVFRILSRQYESNEEARDWLEENVVNKLTAVVPTHLLYPWIGNIRGKVAYELASDSFLNTPYWFSTGVAGKKISFIHLRPEWRDYFLDNNRALEDFANTALTRWLLARNPDLPLIAEGIDDSWQLEPLKDQYETAFRYPRLFQY